MADAAGRFQNLSTLESKPLRGLIHGANDQRRCVMGVKGGGAGGFNLILGQQFGKLSARPARAFGKFGKGGWKSTPANIFYQDRPFFRRGRSLFLFNLPKCADGIEVLIELLLERAFTKVVGIGNAIAIEILRLTASLVVILMVAVR